MKINFFFHFLRNCTFVAKLMSLNSFARAASAVPVTSLPMRLIVIAVRGRKRCEELSVLNGNLGGGEFEFVGARTGGGIGGENGRMARLAGAEHVQVSEVVLGDGEGG